MAMKPTPLADPEVYPPPPETLKVPTAPLGYPLGPDVVEGIPVAQTDGYSYWSTGLCDCFSDMHSCCLVFWCPCIAFGRIAEIVDKGTSSCCRCGSLYMLLYSLGIASSVAASMLGSSAGAASFQWILSFVYRRKLRESLNMPANAWGDCCTHFWCESCALCQEYRELQNRGYDLSLGWEGNMNKQNGSAKPQEICAPVAPAMDR